MKRYLVVDDHPLFRKGLIEMLRQDPRYQLFAEAGNAAEALQLCAAGPPDLAFIDLTLSGSMGGLDLIKTLHALYPGLLILVLSMHEESLYGERALRAGARGYIMKQEASIKVMKAVKEVLSGKLFVNEEVRARAATTGTGGLVGTLSDRELEVFKLLGRGNGMADIARLLAISVKTVEVHREHIKLKLGIRSARELRMFSISWDKDKVGLQKT